MQFSISTAFFALLAVASGSVILQERQNAGRPVPTGACCVANTSLKEDVCNVNGQTGRCVPDSINNCEFILSF